MSSDVQFNLRIPSELKEKVKRAAEQSGRSINAEAQYRLEKSFEDQDSSEFTKGFVLQIIENQQNQIDQLKKMVKDLMNRPI